MSTYLPQIQDYIPQIQPFRPDYNFYAGALQMKQSQYDQGYEQVSSLYGSLLNSPMLRDNNIKARDDYFQVINRDIKKIAGLDLSKRENVNAASKLFSGLYDNDNIVKDMVWTKNYQKELKRADGFKNCVKPEDCGGAYWEGGVRALNYKASEFRGVSDQEALGFENASYVPYQNVMEKAIKAAKDAGLNITVDQLQGRYITTTKNGPMLIEPLQSLFTGLFGSDQSVMDYYKTKAYVDRKDWVQGNIPNYGSEAAAQQAYSEMAMNGLNALYGTSVEDLNSRVETVNGQKKQLEERIRKEGTTPDGSLAEQYRALNNMEQQVTGSKDVYETSHNRYQNAQDPNQSHLRGENLDQAMAYAYLSNDINQAAQTLAYKDYSFEMKADPYAMENTKQANRLALEDVRFKNKLALIDHKYELENWEELQKAQGVENLPYFTPITEGGTEIDLGPDAEYKFFKDKEGNLVADVSGGEKAILAQMLSMTQNKSKVETKEGLKGFATDDLVKFADVLLTELSDPNAVYYFGDDYVSNREGHKTNIKRKEKWDSMTYDQKVKYAHNMDFGSFMTHPSLSGTVIDNVYEKYALPLLDMHNDANLNNRSYLYDLWDSSKSTRYDIEKKNNALQGMGEWRIENSNKTLADMGGAEEFSNWKPLMSIYIDQETGGKRSVGEFAAAFSEAVMHGLGDPEYDPNQSFGYVNDPRTYYDFALQLYKGESPEYGSAVRTNVANALGIDVGAITESFSEGKNIDQVWAEAFSKYAVADGKALGGLVGSGSQAMMAANFDLVDPATYLNEGTVNTISFMSDLYRAETGNVYIQSGVPGSEIPDESDDDYATFMRQLYQDMLTSKDFDDNKRPLLKINYRDIAGGDDAWTAMHITPNMDYVNGMVETKSKPGISKEMGEDIIQNGFTSYLRKSDATNGFRSAMEKTPVEWAMFYTGEYSFDQYPQYTNDVKLTQDNYGNYNVTGTVFSYVNGEVNWVPVPPLTYPAAQVSPEDIIDEVNSWLATEIVPMSKPMYEQYNMEQGTRDPVSLLNQ